MIIIYTALAAIAIIFDRVLCIVSTLDEVVPQGSPEKAPRRKAPDF
jgi:hypothetical protein